MVSLSNHSMSYEAESQALDSEILAVIARWHSQGEELDDAGFNDLALRLFDYQLRYNQSYARYCAAIGVTSPRSWSEIPGMPAAAFKEAALATFDPAGAALVFETSGTTIGTPGRHYMETPALYDAALLAGFDRFVLGDGARPRFLNLVPNPAERPHSSLGYMMARVAEQRGNGHTGWYLRGDALLAEEFFSDVSSATAQAQPVCIATTAFALVHVLDAMEARDVVFALPAGSRVMETGGFKGRARSVDRNELYARFRERFGASDAIVSEYGMTELTSQYYDSPSHSHRGPPWLRARVVGADRRTLPEGIIGALLHVDLANRSSCIAVVTEDLGAATDGGLVLLGRDRESSLRGCSLDAEGLRTTQE
jgi:hypothetical protein